MMSREHCYLKCYLMCNLVKNMLEPRTGTLVKTIKSPTERGQRATHGSPQAWVRRPDEQAQHTPNPVEHQASQVQAKPGTRPPPSPIEGCATHQRRFKVTPKSFTKASTKQRGPEKY